MYHLLAQQNNPLDPKVSKAMEAIAMVEARFGIRASLETALTCLAREEPGFMWIPPQTSNVALRPNIVGTDFSPEGIAARRLNPNYNRQP
ncbi:hypothetical protein D6_0262 [Aeromonas phage D6]|uniref:Uncharacterized protein n=1 Tax=Aeromonas phage D6 TaxID=2593322 RepID=A0A514TWL2_9CAUD|nr:hypothetical protein PQC08_gp013 [Aeromonas phage D6]QDJ97421.1 hypothetical protein D6_0262 [Aeromonas phage D6]